MFPPTNLHGSKRQHYDTLANSRNCGDFFIVDVSSDKGISPRATTAAARIFFTGVCFAGHSAIAYFHDETNMRENENSHHERRKHIADRTVEGIKKRKDSAVEVWIGTRINVRFAILLGVREGEALQLYLVAPRKHDRR